MAVKFQDLTPSPLIFSDGQCLEIWSEITQNDRLPLNEQPKATQKFLSFINVTRPCGGDTIEAGLMAFKESLKNYMTYQSEVWIVYALSGNVDPCQSMTKTAFPHIEMALTLLTTSGAPFVVHMGIARTVYHAEMAFKKRLPTHSKLAILLHGFAAEVMLLHDPKKIWMRTYPTFNMGDIFEKVLPKDIYIKGDEGLKAFSYDEQQKLSIFDIKGKPVSCISKEQLATNEFGFLRHFFFGPPCVPYAITLEGLGKLFKQGLKVLLSTAVNNKEGEENIALQIKNYNGFNASPAHSTYRSYQGFRR